ncbi:MAG: hypothetical protein IJD97_00505 [Clostridia bacterium]|nr:hypothetical protein [Clostridia bacterium]
MKLTLKRCVAVIVAFIMCFSSALSISAKTVKDVSHESNEKGGNVTVFYVNAKNKLTTKLQYTSLRAYLADKDTTETKASYVEVLIYGRNSTSESWTQISKKNIKGKAVDTLKMSGYTQYKVRVYSWKTATIGKTLGSKWDSSTSWLYYGPTCTFKPLSNVKTVAQ